MKPDIYLEISGRSTGKTYRLTQAIANWLRAGNDNVALLRCPVPRMAKAIVNESEALTNWMKPQIYTSETKIPDGKVVKRFYDEFDLFELLTLPEDLSGYYVTSLGRSRTPEEQIAPNTNDPLLELIRANGGMYVTYHPVLHPLTDLRIMADVVKQLPADVVRREYFTVLTT